MDDKRVSLCDFKSGSPGGEVMASDEINKAILNFRTNP